MNKILTALVVTAATFSTNAANAALVTVSTAELQFDAGVLNQGWWAIGASHAATTKNTNTYTGKLGSDVLRSFHTFDLSRIEGNIVSATFRVNWGVPSGTVNLGLWDVTTDAKTVNANIGHNDAIYTDLGSGINYGNFVLTTRPANEKLQLTLNAQALKDLNAASKYFTIGAAVDTNQFLYSSSGAGFLDLEVSAIPEPANLALFGMGLACLLARRRKA